MNHTIGNEYLKVGILERGAELASLVDLSDQKEYIWQADDSRFWGRHSSILFPVIGACNNDIIRVNGHSYPMPKHGIVRNAKFDIEKKASDQIVFILKSTLETKKHYPFDWTLKIHYALVERSLSITYEVINDNEVELPYSIGGHPAFRCPIQDGLRRSEYNLEFDKEEYQNSPKIDHNGLISKETINILDGSNKINLEDHLFDEDAIILTQLKSTKVAIRSNIGTGSALEVTFDGFTHLGIWSNPGVPPFVCIEPWCGIADPIGYEGDICSKPGILNLAPQCAARHTHIVKI